MTEPSQTWPTRLSSGIAALVTVFLLIVGFTYSDDAVEFLLDVTDNAQLAATNRQWLVMGVDLVLVVASAALKRLISDGREPLATFLRGLLTGWWGLAALLVIVAHLALIVTSERRARLGDVASVWISLVATIVFVAAMTMLMLTAVSDKPGSRGWVAPLVFGTFIVQIASVLWYPVIEVPDGCAGDISPTYFSDMTNILALTLLAISVELNYVRRTARAVDPGRRMAPVFTVLYLCIALGLGFTMLVKADLAPRCGVGAVWHEYISFVVTTQALTIGLATMVWLVMDDAVRQGQSGGTGHR